MAEIEPSLIREKLAEFRFELSEGLDGEVRLRVDRAASRGLLTQIRADPQISMRRLVDLSAIDHFDREPRFELVYRLHSPGLNTRLRVHVPLEAKDPIADSVAAIWPAANWFEREVFDLFGILFQGHPNLERILLPTDFEGAPLRKDYPRQPGLGLPKRAQS